MSLTEAFEQLQSRRAELVDSLQAKGVEVEPTDTLKTLIEQVRGLGEADGEEEEEWAPHPDWVAMPPMPDTGVQKLYAIVAVFPNYPFCAVSAAVLSGQYRVDWGDGSVTLHNSNVRADHTYDYQVLASPVVNVDGETYKTALITVTPVIEGQMRTVSPAQSSPADARSNYRYPSLLWLRANLPAVTSLALFSNMVVSFPRLECVEVQEHAITNFTNMFLYCRSLRRIQFDTSQVTSFNQAFSGCFSLRSIDLDTSSGENFAAAFESCYSLRTVKIDTSNGTNFNRMFNACYALRNVQLDTSQGNNFSNMFQNCSSLRSVQLDTSQGNNFSTMFSGCYSLQSASLDISGGTNFTQMFLNCYLLRSVSLGNTSLATIFTQMFNNCISLYRIPQLDTSHGTNFTSMFNGCQQLRTISLDLTAADPITTSSMFASLSVLEVLQLTVGSGVTALDLSGTALGRDQLVAVFNALYDRAGLDAGTITITNTLGLPQITAQDRQIATAKNWAIVPV